MRLSQLSSTCYVIPLATKNFALIATLLAVAVSHVQPSTVICCPLQVDRVDFFFMAPSFEARETHRYLKNRLGIVRAWGLSLIHI